MSEQPSERCEIRNLKDLYNPEWFTAPEQSTVWVRIFTSLTIAPAGFKTTLSQILRKVPVFDPPVAIAFGDFGGLKIPKGKFTYVHTENDGSTAIDLKADVELLPKSNYIAFSTPHTGDGRAGNEVLSRRTIDVVAALIRAHCGASFLRQIVFDGEVNVTSGDLQVASEGIAVPQPCEGPFVNEANWSDVCEIAEELQRTSHDKSGRIMLALEYLSKAFHDREPFFSYWTALNILCKGKSWQAMRDKLMNCYNLKTRGEAERKTGIRILGKWRNDFYHDGVKPFLKADIERYLQLMILDLVRFELGLPHRGHLAGIQHAAGYDLTSIGLHETSL